MNTNNIIQLDDHRDPVLKTANIFETVEAVKDEDGPQGAEVLPFNAAREKPEEDDRPTDEEFDEMWSRAVDDSSAIVSTHRGSIYGLMLLSNLIDDLQGVGYRTSTVMNAVQDGFELQEKRITAYAEEADDADC